MKFTRIFFEVRAEAEDGKVFTKNFSIGGVLLTVIRNAPEYDERLLDTILFQVRKAWLELMRKASA